MEFSELIPAREQLIQKRKQLVKDLWSQQGAWVEFHQVCRAIEQINNKLAEGVTEHAESPE